MENTNPESDQLTEFTNFSAEVKHFYQGEFKEILSTFFKSPKEGIREIFENSSEVGYKKSLIFYISVFILYVSSMYIFLGSYARLVGIGYFIKMGLIPVIMMLSISVISFGIKSIYGKPNFKNELLTGGICGIPITLFLIGFLLLIIFGSSNSMNLIYSPGSGGFISSLLFIYILVMVINVMQQSLLAFKVKETFAWYISPVAIILAGLIAFKVMDGLFS